VVAGNFSLHHRVQNGSGAHPASYPMGTTDRGVKLVSHFGGEHRLRFFENKVLRKIFGSKREEDRSWRKLHNDELHSLYSSPNIVRVIKSRRMRWAGHVARMGKRCLQGFGWEDRRQETTEKA
jgi:hypothetical protein